MAIIKPVYVSDTSQLEKQLKNRASVICVINPELIEPLKTEIQEGNAKFLRSKKLNKRLIGGGIATIAGGAIAGIFSPFLIAGALAGAVGYMSTMIGASGLITDSISRALKSQLKNYTWTDAAAPNCLMLLRNKAPNAYNSKIDTIDDSELLTALEKISVTTDAQNSIKKPIFDVQYKDYHITVASFDKREHLYINYQEYACKPADRFATPLSAEVDGSIVLVKLKDSFTLQLLFDNHEIGYCKRW